MANITAALARVKRDYQYLLSPAIIVQFCTTLGHRWRDRRLGPADTVQLFVLQILHGNIAINAIRRLASIPFTDSAYVQARQRLPVQLFHDLLAWINTFASPLQHHGIDDPRSLFHGHRVHLIDGSNASMPDTPALQKHFGQPSGQKPGCGFPAAHLLYLIDLATGMILSITISPLFTHDLRHALSTHARLAAGDLLMGDRGFCSHAHIALLLQAGMHALFRLHQRMQVPPVRPPAHPQKHPRKRRPKKPRPPTLRRERTFACSGPILEDVLVSWRKPPTCPAWLRESDYAPLPEQVSVRLIRYRVTQRGFRTREIMLATTLADPQKYPALDLARLYQRRWEIEGHLRELKQTMGMGVLRTRSVEGVTRELLAYAIVYNLVRLTMLEAAKRQGVPVERVSFVDALRWLASAEGVKELAALVINPDRPGRVQPRKVKRRPKQYGLLMEPRKKWLQRLKKTGIAA